MMHTIIIISQFYRVDENRKFITRKELKVTRKLATANKSRVSQGRGLCRY